MVMADVRARVLTSFPSLYESNDNSFILITYDWNYHKENQLKKILEFMLLLFDHVC